MDDYRRTAKNEWSSKGRKWESQHRGRIALKRQLEKLPREPEVHPAEIEEIEFRAGCKARGLCSFCGDKLPCGGCL